jgi:hypothetical protein
VHSPGGDVEVDDPETKQLHAAGVELDPLSALVHAWPIAFVGVVGEFTQMPRSLWHELPDGQSESAAQPPKQYPMPTTCPVESWPAV